MQTQYFSASHLWSHLCRISLAKTMVNIVRFLLFLAFLSTLSFLLPNIFRYSFFTLTICSTNIFQVPSIAFASLVIFRIILNMQAMKYLLLLRILFDILQIFRMFQMQKNFLGILFVLCVYQDFFRYINGIWFCVCVFGVFV